MEIDYGILPVEKRREIWLKCYKIELARAHALGKIRWPIEQLDDVAERWTDGFTRGHSALGESSKAAMKALKIKPTMKALKEFLS